MAIGESLKERLRAKFTRRHSTASSVSSADGDAHKTTRSLKSTSIDDKDEAAAAAGVADSDVPKLDVHVNASSRQLKNPATNPSYRHPNNPPSLSHLEVNLNINDSRHNSSSTADFPTPNTTEFAPVLEEAEDENEVSQQQNPDHIEIQFSGPSPESIASKSPKPELSRRQSLLPHQQTRLIKTLLETELPLGTHAASIDYFANHGPSTISANMVSRKIWVKRPGASATLVTIHEDDLVDDVRDMILKKYANSLGRNFDAPDVTLRIIPRENRQERTLGPEEPMGRTLDMYFLGGQTVDEALVIDVPLRRTPKPSPRPNGYYDDHRPLEVASDYFPPMPAAPAMPSPRLPNALPVNGQCHPVSTSHSMSVLTTGHVPNLPSPGSARRHHRDRPRVGRTHTTSPTVLQGQAQSLGAQHNGMQAYPLQHPHSRTHSSASEKSITAGAPPLAPPLPTPPTLHEDDLASQIQRVATPPPRVNSPRPSRAKKSKKANVGHPSLPAGMLNGAVPPINVLIVEDNIINLKLLEAFMKRLKVRWQTAMNGREAVTKWRAGGFHLVLMDIQLPIMSGLEATKEIRRLERLNSIGVFSSSASSSASSGQENGEPEGEDKLPSTVLFKSPVIIVALTASSLQSDRHEALAAGCNDFLTKPVNFVWLERKVMEWGCMQALIDFDGWRKWKDFSQGTADEGVEKKKITVKKKKDRRSLGSNPGAGSSRVTIPEE